MSTWEVEKNGKIQNEMNERTVQASKFYNLVKVYME
jgi:hypothetical protein